jgi:mRNA-degrading endonuclease YafQ of YafQ-DinJ toxin-antitoxin module
MGAIQWNLCWNVSIFMFFKTLWSMLFLSAFEMWLGEQFKTNEFSAVFQSLINEQKVPPNFPTHLLQSEITGDMRISVDPVLRNCINKLIGKTGEDDDTVSLQETRGLFNEIATTDEPGLSFEDFVGIFKQ